MSESTAYRICPLCEATCGLELTITDGRVTGARGDSADVFSHGFICPKGATIDELDNDPDRLRAPMVRTGDNWHEVTWDEAFAAVERGLGGVAERHGRQPVHRRRLPRQAEGAAQARWHTGRGRPAPYPHRPPRRPPSDDPAGRRRVPALRGGAHAVR